ncbi:hypothetical protein ACFSVK_06170 [Azorhizophilus paspali]|uniref:hypothetical protein n=1 Tax=Azorhizophilus paspali TaxID=69963 RepID=UPI0036254B2C
MLNSFSPVFAAKTGQPLLFKLGCIRSVLIREHVVDVQLAGVDPELRSIGPCDSQQALCIAAGILQPLVTDCLRPCYLFFRAFKFRQAKKRCLGLRFLGLCLAGHDLALRVKIGRQPAIAGHAEDARVYTAPEKSLVAATIEIKPPTGAVCLPQAVGDACALDRA